MNMRFIIAIRSIIVYNKSKIGDLDTIISLKLDIKTGYRCKYERFKSEGFERTNLCNCTEGEKEGSSFVNWD